MNGREDQVRAADFGLFLIRGIVGVVFMFHGSQKLFGWFGGTGASLNCDTRFQPNRP